MLKNIFIILFCFCLIITTTSSAQTVSRVGTTAAPFLKIGVGARVLGMGEAGATVAEDITAMYWNPAGLARITKSQILLNHFEWIADINFDYAGIAIYVPTVGSFGLNITHWGAPDIERTTLTYQEGTGEKVSMGSTAIGVSFAREFTDRFSIGFNGKYIRESLWHSHAQGYALDVGILFNTQFHNLKLGASISNFGTALQMQGRDLLVQHDIDPLSEGNNSNINAYLATDSYKLPIFFRFGLSMNVTRDLMGIDNHDFIVAIDAIHPNDNKEYVNMGAEYRLMNLLSLRAGYRELFLQDTEGGLTAGFGLHHGIGSFALSIDYAALDYGRLDYVHKFSFILSF